MSSKKKIGDHVRIFKWIFRHLSKYDQLFIDDQQFIGLIVVLFLSFLIVGLALFGFHQGPLQFDACLGPFKDNVTRDCNVPQRFISEREVYSEPIEDFKISYDIEVFYSSKGAITINHPIRITIKGVCVINESKLDTPESFVIKFYPRNAININSEDSAVISATAYKKGEPPDVGPRYEFNGTDIVKFQRSGKNPLWVEFRQFGLQDRGVEDVFTIDPAQVKFQLETTKWVMIFSLITVYLGIISILNIIRGIYRNGHK